ncbi:signal transduction histidine kinase [Nocardiopsis arvandica]|uniref:histidine kinase n=1 Tax=Nocardiopsis sinuspersici TaxID=501010 RepID=A0A7Y9XIV9_9ACTN|nr:histidine kinase [Nocardiopsis sinuspersici]NYH55405.1 signal transduction histidine kinase [Nocardiopsis sinuspersici]
MSERDHGRPRPLLTAGLALSCVSAPLHPVALLAVGTIVLSPSLRRAPATMLCLVAGASLATGCTVAVLSGAQDLLVIANGSAGALAVALSCTLGRHLNDRERYRETGWRLAWALDSRRRAVDAQARASERARIAAEMHDSLGHDMALIAVRASALEAKASSPSPNTPPHAELTELRTAAAEATHRLHEIVTLLNAEQPRPASALTDESLTALIEEAESAGMVIHHDIDPSWSDTAEPCRMLGRRTVHRLVRESLTNAAKHAPGADVDVSVRQRKDTVHVVVRNRLPTPDTQRSDTVFAPSGGRGLRALEERVRVLGGSMEWGPLDGRFALAAAIPVDGAPSVDADTAVMEAEVDPEAYRSHTMRRRHRSLRALVLAPLSVLLCAFVLVAALFTFTTFASVLPADRFARIHTGQSQAEAEELLPPVEMHDAPVADEPTRDCRYYEESVSFFERVDVFQACFAGGAVTHTARIPAERG